MHGSNLKDPKNQFLFISSIPIKFVSGMVLTVLIAASVLYMGVPQMWGDAQASTQNARDDAAMIEEQLATPTLAESGQPNVHSDGWDLDFGENGKVNTGCASWADVLDPSTSDAPNNNHYSRVRIQSTGKILLSISCDRQWTLARYNIDGTVDASFGTNGKIVTDFNIFAVQNDDKILAELGLSIARFDADGQPDLSFGNGGVADALASSDPSAWFTKVVLQENGQITALGKMGDQRIIARYNSDGTLDTTFNGSGYLLSATGHQSADFRECLYGSGLAVQSDGKILVTYCKYELVDAFNEQYKLVETVTRYEVNSEKDAGWAEYRIDTIHPTVRGIGVQPTGRIIVAANGKVVALQPDGTVDPSFLPHKIYDLLNFQLYGDGRILLRNGIAPYQLTRLLPTGVLDQDFGINGSIWEPEGNEGEKLEQAIEPSGNLILGLKLWNSTPHLKLTRYIDDGPLATPVPEITPDPNELTATPTVTPDSGDPTVTPDSGELTATPEPTGSTPTPDWVPTPVVTVTPGTATLPQPLVMIYAVLDNNLGDNWTRLINNIEAGTTEGATVRLLIDGPRDDGDVYVFDVGHDVDPFCPSLINLTCDGRYEFGRNLWQFSTEDTARPESLYQFLVDSANAYPNATQTVLSLVGHGSGWSANVLPGQPRVWSDQNDTVGGMLWDDHPQAGEANSHSLSTLALGEALEWATNSSGKKIDLLYLDGCSMGMVEVAYEVRTSTEYLLSSPNIDWASFNYNNLLPEVANGMDSRALGESWLTLEASELRANPGHPFTLALADLNQIDTLTDTVDDLARSLVVALQTDKQAITDAFNATERFDSNFDGMLDNNDSYIDLVDFAQHLAVNFADEGGVMAAQLVENRADVAAQAPTLPISEAADRVEEAMLDLIVAKDYQGGVPWVFSDQNWQWESFGGIGIYSPLSVNEERRQLFYNGSNLSWASATEWDEFLDMYWMFGVRSAQVVSMPVCRSTAERCEGLANQLPEQGMLEIHLPFVVR